MQYIIDDRETPRFRVNRRTMIDPDIYRIEQERIFDRCWLYVGHESELPKKHDFKTREVGGRPIIFTRKSDGTVGVFINSCTHRGAMLCREKSGNGRFIRCFYHAWSFDTSGRLVAMPDDESYGPTFDRDRLCLVSPPKIDSYRGFVFCCFDPDAPDLVTYLAGAATYLDLRADQSEEGELEIMAGTHEYSMRANWKLLVENSIDGYHGLPTHQRYFEMVQAAVRESEQPQDQPLREGAGVNLGNGHALVGSHSPQRRPFGVGRPFRTETAQRAWNERWDRIETRYGKEWAARIFGGGNLLIFPNLLIIDLLGGMVVRVLNPVEPNYMQITMWEAAPVGEDVELRHHRLDNSLTFWGPGGLATPDDVEALECCGVGFRGFKELEWSDISRGMTRETPLGTDEYQMRTFWRRWNELVTGESLPDEHHTPPYWAAYKRPSRLTSSSTIG
jgi:p-cumate 2,3-dioxygenase subunit alpha